MVSVNHVRETENGLDNVTGLDKILQSVQKDVFKYLSKIWNGPIHGSGRVYRNPKDGDIIPERWNGKGYEEVYFDDSYSASFFFIDNSTQETTDGLVFEAKVKLVVLLNLNKIKTPSVERLDEEARQEVVSYLRGIEEGRFRITGLDKGVDAVFAGFDRSRIRLTDMHPKHTFAVRMNVYYEIDQCT